MINSRKNLMEALLDVRERPHIYPEPQKSWEKAIEHLNNSNELIQLTQLAVKITLFPNSPDIESWFEEIRHNLDRLAFLLSKSCRKMIKDGLPQISVARLYFGGNDVLRMMDYWLGDHYWNVIDEMRPELNKIEHDPFNDERGSNFSDIGLEIKEEEENETDGIKFYLYFRGKKIV